MRPRQFLRRLVFLPYNIRDGVFGGDEELRLRQPRRIASTNLN